MGVLIVDDQLFFADGQVVFARSRDHLREMLIILKRYEVMGLKINF